MLELLAVGVLEALDEAVAVIDVKKGERAAAKAAYEKALGDYEDAVTAEQKALDAKEAADADLAAAQLAYDEAETASPRVPNIEQSTKLG